MTAGKGFFDRLQTATEAYLTRRNRLKRIKKEKQKQKNVVLDWLEAFIWAAAVVLLINQYLFQAYQIPSGSMIDTLLIGDRIFVNKMIYGPELLPGVAKLPSPIKPQRNDIIIFENPSYISQGPVFDIVQRLLYMLTLTLVDIDRDESGQPKAHFLIKRAVGMSGDQFRMYRGGMRVRFAGEDRWVEETVYNAARGWTHHISRLMPVASYPALEAAGRLMAYRDLGLTPPADLEAAAASLEGLRNPDYLELDKSRLSILRAADPADGRLRALLARHRLGWYVGEGYVLPLGDNRDNSRDGRYFGPVRMAKVLGKGVLKFWPLRRIGPIR